MYALAQTEFEDGNNRRCLHAAAREGGRAWLETSAVCGRKVLSVSQAPTEMATKRPINDATVLVIGVAVKMEKYLFEVFDRGRACVVEPEHRRGQGERQRGRNVEAKEKYENGGTGRAIERKRT